MSRPLGRQSRLTGNRMRNGRIEIIATIGQYWRQKRKREKILDGLAKWHGSRHNNTTDRTHMEDEKL